METQLTLDVLKKIGFKPILNPFTEKETGVLEFENLKICQHGDDFKENKFTLIHGEKYYKIQWLEVLIPLLESLNNKDFLKEKHPI